MPILFRSKYGFGGKSGSSQKKTPLLREDWSDIGIYQEGSDSRDILWKKSTHTLLYVKNRDMQSQIRLIFWIDIEASDAFFLHGAADSRYEWKRQSRQVLQDSAKQLHTPWRTFWKQDFATTATILQKEQMKRHLVVIISNKSASEALPLLGSLAQVNEIIWIHPSHFWEKAPTTDFLFEGRVFSKRKLGKYQQQLQKNIQEEKRCFHTKHIVPLFTFTNIPLEKTLNHFFKYQYVG